MSTKLAVNKPELALIAGWHSSLELETQAGDISTTTVTTYKTGMDKFMRWVQANKISQVTGETVQKWKADLLDSGYSAGSVNTWLKGVRRFFDWGVASDRLLVNPAAAVKGVKRRGTNKKHLRDALTDREVLRVLAQPDRETDQGKRDYAILALKAYCALRDVEIHRTDIEDLSTVDGLPVLRVQGKGATEKDDISVIYSAQAQEAVYDWLAVRGNKPGAMFYSLSDRSRGKRLSLRSIRHIVMECYRQAGIVDKRKTSHSLRHSAISKVAQKDIMKAREVARHVSVDTTMIYVHENNRIGDPGEALIEYSNNGNGE